MRTPTGTHVCRLAPASSTLLVYADADGYACAEYDACWYVITPALRVYALIGYGRAPCDPERMGCTTSDATVASLGKLAVLLLFFMHAMNVVKQCVYDIGANCYVVSIIQCVVRRHYATHSSAVEQYKSRTTDKLSRRKGVYTLQIVHYDTLQPIAEGGRCVQVGTFYNGSDMVSH